MWCASRCARGALQLLVVGAQRRAAIAGDVAGGVQPGGKVALPLHQRQPHQRLDAGDEDPSRGDRVLVVESDLEQLRHLPTSSFAPQASTRRGDVAAHRIERSSPPSTRSAARWCRRTGGWRCTRPSRRSRPSSRTVAAASSACGLEELALHLLQGLALRVGQILDELLDPSERVGPGQDRVHRHAGADRGLGEAAGQRHLHGLGDAVVDHLDRDVHRRFRRR